MAPKVIVIELSLFFIFCKQYTFLQNMFLSWNINVLFITSEDDDKWRVSEGDTI